MCLLLYVAYVEGLHACLCISHQPIRHCHLNPLPLSPSLPFSHSTGSERERDREREPSSTKTCLPGTFHTFHYTLPPTSTSTHTTTHTQIKNPTIQKIFINREREGGREGGRERLPLSSVYVVCSAISNDHQQPSGLPQHIDLYSHYTSLAV